MPTSATRRHTAGILAAILICQLMVVLDSTVVNIALPHIQTALHMRATDLSWVLNAYILTFGGFLLLGARAGDLKGRRKVFISGIALFTVSSLAAGLAGTSGLLLGARAVQGVGAALASPSALALLTITFREGRERMKALAWYTAVSIGGSAVGLVVGGMIVAWASWRWIFFINLPIGVVLIVLARSVLPETDPHPGALDWAGALTSTVGMSAIVYALVRAGSGGWGDPVTVVSFAVGAVLLVTFVLVERRATTPITPLRIFADRNRSTSYLVRLLLVGASFGMFFFLSQFLQEVLGYSAIQTGLAFVPITACLFATSQLSAHVLSSRVSAKLQMLVGLIMSAAGLFVLAGLTIHSSYASLIIALVLFGSGNGFAFVPLTNMALAGVAHEDAGAASGVLNAAQQIGGALGLAVLVTVFGSASKDKARHLSPTLSAHLRQALPFVAGVRVAYWVATGLALGSVALVATVRLPPRSELPASGSDMAEAEAAGAAGLA